MWGNFPERIRTTLLLGYAVLLGFALRRPPHRPLTPALLLRVWVAKQASLMGTGQAVSRRSGRHNGALAFSAAALCPRVVEHCSTSFGFVIDDAAFRICKPLFDRSKRKKRTRCHDLSYCICVTNFRF